MSAIKSNHQTIDRDKLKSLLAGRKQTSKKVPEKSLETIPIPEPEKQSIQIHGLNDSEIITLNDRQQQAIDTVLRGEDCIIIGAAGTGKTTCMSAVIQALELQNIGTLDLTHKYLNSGTPAILCSGYTNRAVKNLAKATPENLKSNCITIHKLLEFQPEWYEIYDDEKGF